MPDHDSVVVYVATYARLEDARADFVAVTERYAGGVVRTVDTTVIGHKLDGKLKIVSAEHPDAGKAWIGLGAGELGGLFIPPLFIPHTVLGLGAGISGFRFGSRFGSNAG